MNLFLVSFSYISRFCNTGECRFQACKSTSGSCPCVEKQAWLWDANRQQCRVLNPISATKLQPLLRPLAQQHNLHKGTTLNSELSHLPASEGNLETGSFYHLHFLCLRLCMSSGYPTCSPCLGSRVVRTRAVPTYAIPNPFLAQAMIKCSMSWYIIQLGLEEPGWKLHSLHCMVYYELFPWCICS